MRRTTIFIQDALERELKALARRDGRPVAAVVREAVEQYVVAARRTAPARLGFIAAGRSGRRDIAERHEDLLFESLPAARPAAQPPATRPSGSAPRRPRTGRTR